LSSVYLPARFESLGTSDSGFPLIVDGAHTPVSIRLCAETFSRLYGSGILLFGCAADKDVEDMAEILVRYFSDIIITSPGSFRASDPEKAFSAFRKKAGKSPPHISLVPDTQTAIKEALKLSREKQLPVLGCGSFYLAGEIIKFHRGS
jgi:dihydrofolate synthase/folylpolyglutamate synthase